MRTIHREIRLESNDFPTEHLGISKLEGVERIGELFWFDIRLTNHQPADFNAVDMMAAEAVLVFIEDDREVRRVFGMISEAVDELDTEGDRCIYRIRFVPRAFRLTLVKIQEVFLNATLQNVIARKLGLVGLAEDFDFRLSEEKLYAAREFTVQYDETDLAFISRLCEHVGVSFYFDHTTGRDRVVFCDRNEGFGVAPHEGKLHFTLRGDHAGVYRFETKYSTIPSEYVVSDYNYETPLVDLSAACKLPDGYGGGVIEYGTNLRDPGEASAFAHLRAEALEAGKTVFSGESSHSIGGGMRAVIEGHPTLGQVDLLVVEATHTYTEVDQEGGRYENRFRAIPYDVRFRPPRATERPRILGLSSGVVEAAPGVETVAPWIDEHGRYLVRVYFDTAPSGERKASLPIRMAQAHAGPNYGVHFPLRPGTEVLLSFIGGDPDRPVIVGSVPNAVTPTPVTSREATFHRIRTASGVLVEIDDGF